ncbi:MAG: right-handed parallel beta-helix repeat-containing protein [Phycisphaeraceae bacterium]|nr:right-handed parallel beta-helix repeat-containing protein [Phycisphaeraceae bacterium]
MTNRQHVGGVGCLRVTAAVLVAVCGSMTSFGYGSQGRVSSVPPLVGESPSTSIVRFERVVTTLADGRQVVRLAPVSIQSGAPVLPQVDGSVVVPGTGPAAFDSQIAAIPVEPAGATAGSTGSRPSRLVIRSTRPALLATDSQALATDAAPTAPESAPRQRAILSDSPESQGAVLGSGWVAEESGQGSDFDAQARSRVVAPRAPSSARVTAGDGSQVIISWSDRSSVETGYTVAREQRVNGTWRNGTTFDLPANSTSYRDNPGAGEFRYRIRAYNSGGSSSYTSWVRIVVAGQDGGGGGGGGGGDSASPPAAPTGARILDNGNGKVTISWTDASNNESGFEVVRQRVVGTVNGWPDYGDWTQFPQPANATAYSDTPGTGTFRYQVRAVNGAGASAYTPWVEITPAAAVSIPTPPASIAVTNGSDSMQARVTWEDRSNNETGFNIVREKLSGSNWIEPVPMNVDANVTSYTDAPGAGTFRYKVAARNSAGFSVFTPSASITLTAPPPPSAIPSVPTALQPVAQPDGRSIRVTWTDTSNNETGFELIRQTRVEVNGIEDFNAWIQFPQAANVTQFYDEPGPGTYRYMIRANGQSGNSAWSPWVLVNVGTTGGSGGSGGGGTTNPTPPAAPTSMTVQDLGNGRVLASWTDNSNNETSFELERNPAFSGGSVVLGADQTAYINDVSAGTYGYRVRASNAAGSSAYTAYANITISGSTPPPPPPPTGGGGGVGWTDLTPASDARVVYVSSSLGNNANSGLDSAHPVRTLAAGYALLRTNTADQMLLQCGDVWTEEFPGWGKNGRSASERMIVGSYGNGARPKIQPTSRTRDGIFERSNSNGNLIITGLEISGYTSRHTAGFQWQLGGGANVLIEDCHIHHCTLNIVLQDMNGGFVIRRSIIDMGGPGNNGDNEANSGFYIALTHAPVTIEECVIDRCGDHPDIRPGSTPGIRSQSVYCQDTAPGVIFRKNLVSNGGCMGPDLRAGGTIEDCIITRCAIGPRMGSATGTDTPGGYPGGVTGTVRNVFVLDGTNIRDNNPDYYRGVGFWLENVRNCTVDGLVIARKGANRNPDSCAIEMHTDPGSGVNGVTFTNTRIYQWTGNGGTFAKAGNRQPSYTQTGTVTSGFPNPSVAVTEADISLAKTMRRGFQDPLIDTLLTNLRAGFYASSGQ